MKYNLFPPLKLFFVCFFHGPLSQTKILVTEHFLHAQNFQPQTNLATPTITTTTISHPHKHTLEPLLVNKNIVSVLRT